MERACPFGGGHVHFDLVGEKGRAPFAEGAPLWGRARPFGRGHVHFDLVGEKGRAPFAEGAPLWKRALSKCHIENLTY